jgi:hypothetical protein
MWPPRRGRRAAVRARHRDSEIHARRSALQAEIEEHDIDQMVSALDALRRRNGGRGIGDELADKITRER